MWCGWRSFISRPPTAPWASSFRLPSPTAPRCPRRRIWKRVQGLQERHDRFAGRSVRSGARQYREASDALETAERTESGDAAENDARRHCSGFGSNPLRRREIARRQECDRGHHGRIADARHEDPDAPADSGRDGEAERAHHGLRRGNGANATVQTTAENLVPALRLAAEMLREPAFPDSEFDQVKKQRIAGIENRRTEPGALAPLALERTLNPFPQERSAVRRDDRRRYRRYGQSHAGRREEVLHASSTARRTGSW